VTCFRAAFWSTKYRKVLSGPSVRPQRLIGKSPYSQNAVLSLQALVVGSIWLAAAEELFLSLKVPVIASINQQCSEIRRRARNTNGR